MNKSYRGRSCPIVVHCSDGAGRTGTYCLIDMVLSRMAKGAKEIDIAATLEHLRDQRPRMVSKIYTNHLLLFYTYSLTLKVEYNAFEGNILEFHYFASKVTII